MMEPTPLVPELPPEPMSERVRRHLESVYGAFELDSLPDWRWDRDEILSYITSLEDVVRTLLFYKADITGKAFGPDSRAIRQLFEAAQRTEE